MVQSEPRRRVRLFFLATAVISWGAWWILVGLARSGVTSFGRPLFMTLYMLGGFGPTIAAYLAVLRTPAEGTVAEYHGRLFRWRVNPLWFAVALVLPFAIAFTTIDLGGRLDPRVLDGIAMKPWSQVVPLFLMMIVGGGLEELGWRGVAQPELERTMPRFAATLGLGVIWALWHLPLFVLPGVGQYGTSFPIFAVSTVGLAFILAWVYGRTGSILLCVMLHASTNAVSGMGLRIPTTLPIPSLADGLVKLALGVGLLLADRRPGPADRR